ncbi:MAG: DUF4835 family protein [Muribaculaceae bacterium]|jgi:hypothetical protein|nr:DUF4835 family protein [Muribaculaceae bacterium]
MKKALILILAALACALTVVADDEATELNCEVEVNSDKITSGSKDVFNELKQSVTDYMNMTKWTNATFGTNEKINCKLMFTLSSWDQATGVMQGDLQIQSQRPVFNSSYTTAIINFRDTKISFSFETGQQLVFSELEMEDNLTAILNFWAYMIIAMDFDSFELHGGDPYYERAAQVVRLAQTSSESGWKAFEDNTNRNAVLSAFTDNQTAPIRQMLYDYHRMGLDQMVVTVDKGRSTITHTLENLAKIYEVAPMSVCLTMFKDAKLDELINIYSKANTTEKESVYEMLYQVYPSETTRLDQIKKTEN